MSNPFDESYQLKLKHHKMNNRKVIIQDKGNIIFVSYFDKDELKFTHKYAQDDADWIICDGERWRKGYEPENGIRI